MYRFTTQWFADSELKQLLPQLMKDTNVNRILEIGCYEGQSAVHFADVYCKHADSCLVLVDPFDVTDTTNPVKPETETLFDENIMKSQQNSKIKVFKQYSDDFFKVNMERFTFIYIDGSHEPMQIVKDAINAYKVLEVGGFLWFDDYLGGGGETKIRDAIDFWVGQMRGKIQVVHKNYQLGCRKVA
jgi:predicted O-methyltransferase YrrM